MNYKKVALIGAGARGRIAYGSYILNNQDKIRYVAVVEPDKAKREICAKEHQIDSSMVFETEEEFFKLGKVCDAIVIAHQDKQHFKTVMSALDLKYDVLLEKPMSPSAQECFLMDKKAREQNALLMVCHVLRYTTFFSTLKHLIDSGEIGEMYGMDHVENIGNYHMAHSFVRGNWRNKAETSPIILSKTCHDMDIITWLVNSKCTTITSKGRLNYFKEANAPKESGEKCLNCQLQDSCRYSAKKVYLGSNIGIWPANTLCADQTEETIKTVLDTTPYGTCVWKVKDNDVCDHQTALMSFENGVEATFCVTAFSANQFRETRIYGSEGSIYASTKDNCITVKKHLYREGDAHQIIKYYPEVVTSGHGGGDSGLMDDFVKQLFERGEVKTSSSQSLQSHIMSLAAEESRLLGKQVEIDEFMNELGDL